MKKLLILLPLFILLASFVFAEVIIDPDDFLFYYSFEGNTNDVSGNGQNESDSSGISYTSTAGKVGGGGNSIFIPLSADFVSFTHNESQWVMNDGQNFTLSFWVSTINGASGEWSNAFNKGSADNDACWEGLLGSANPSNLQVQMYFNGRAFSSIPANLVQDADVSLITYVRNGTSLKGYQNGLSDVRSTENSNSAHL